MGLIIKNKKQYYTRIPLGIVCLILFSLSPAIIGFGGAWITQLLTTHTVNEGNSAWLGFPWLTLFTIPIGFILLIMYLIIIIMDIVKLNKA